MFIWMVIPQLSSSEHHEDLDGAIAATSSRDHLMNLHVRDLPNYALWSCYRHAGEKQFSLSPRRGIFEEPAIPEYRFQRVLPRDEDFPWPVYGTNSSRGTPATVPAFGGSLGLVSPGLKTK